jgi:ligand-binding sensor domain-containing protein/serine phosphatase RsbU (regulator of sigma subunit)
MISDKILRGVWTPLFIAVAMFSTALSQEGIQFQHITVKDGLSQGSVLCILQDRQGLMWFGTQDGLNRYDGYKFIVFRHDPADPHTLNDNFIVFLAEDSSGTLWVGTLNSPTKLNRYDPSTESFREFPADSVNLRGARINAVRSQYEDQSGVWWYGIKDGGVKRVDPSTGKTRVYKHSPSDTSSLSNNDVFQIVGDRTGALWISTGGGLDRFEPQTETFLHYRHDDNNPKSLSDNETWPLLLDRQGNLWVGSYRGGLNRFDHAKETFVHYRHSESDPRSLAGDRLYALYQDRSGMIWVGTGDNGLDRFHPELAAFAHYAHDPGKRSTLTDNNVQSMCVDRKGIVWIGTRSGLNRLDRATETFTSYKADKHNPGSIGDDMAQALLVDRAGVLWVGTSSNGLDRMNPADGSFTHYRHDSSNPLSLSDNSIYALCEDRRGGLWVGTYSGGLDRFDSRTRTFQLYRHNPSVPASLGADGAWSLMEDRDGVLWVGTYGGGLNEYNPHTDGFTHYIHDAADPTSLSDNIVLCTCEDRTGTLWIGTTSGLNRFDRQTRSFEHFFEKDGLANDMVFGILEDNHGNLWISTNKGISKFNPQSNKFVTYDYSNGLQGNEFNQGAYAKDPRTGEIFFGGANGFNVFDPDNVKNNPYIPPVVFSSFTRYNSDNAEGRPIEEHGIREKGEIAVSYKDNILLFEFAALNYYNSDKNQYAYQLEGFNDNWIHLGTDRRATFTNLGGGDYILRVRGSNNDGLWNEEGAVLRIIVTPPWWKTHWAYGTYAVLLLGFLYGIRNFELNRQKQKARIRESDLHAKAVEAEKRALEAENERQTKELEDARKLQLSMLPKEVPQLPDYEIAVFMKTATEVGGDYYDFNVTPDGHLTVALGDATGHGMQAGTIVTLMKGLFVSEGSKYDIQTFFNNCSRAIKDIRLGRLYMALTLARFAGKNVYLSSAGMPPAYIHRKRTGTVDEILMKAVPLGSMKNFPYPLYETVVENGDTLLFLTDGLPEQKNTNEEMFDYSRVIDCFKSVADLKPDEIIAHLLRKAEQWMNGAVQDDDITLLVMRKKDAGM